MRRIDISVGWLLVAFGAVHLSFDEEGSPEIDINAVWFASGGLMIITIGALNLLRVAYSSVAKGVHVVSVIANVVLLALTLFIASLLPIRSNPQVLVWFGTRSTAYRIVSPSPRGPHSNSPDAKHKIEASS